MEELSTLALIAKEGIGEADKHNFDEKLSNTLGNLRLLFGKQEIILGAPGLKTKNISNIKDINKHKKDK